MKPLQIVVFPLEVPILLLEAADPRHEPLHHLVVAERFEEPDSFLEDSLVLFEPGDLLLGAGADGTLGLSVVGPFSEELGVREALDAPGRCMLRASDRSQ